MYKREIMAQLRGWAGSVVVKDIPDGCVAVGNPCKVVKYLNITK